MDNTTEALHPSPTVTLIDTPTATPTWTETPTFAPPTPIFTPGPTPTAVKMGRPPESCLATPLPLDFELRREGSIQCLVWPEKVENETGYRVILQFGYDGEMFIYDTPANVPAMIYPAVLQEPLDQSFEYCMAHKDFSVTIYALVHGQEPKIISGWASDLECNIFTMPSATPQPPTAIPN